MKPSIIAHRCGPGRYPEQSLAAAKHALALGADRVEMDVRYTRDGEPVICHDENTARVFGVDGLCREMTLERFRTLRHLDDPGCPAHTLEDVFDSPVRPLLLHCKFSGPLLADLAGRVRDRNIAGDCVLGVQDPEDVAIVHAACPKIRVLAFMRQAEALRDFLSGGAAFIRLWEDWVTPARVRQAHEVGKGLWVMAGKPEEGLVGVTEADRLLEWRELGVDGILINDVAWAIGVLRPGGRA